MSQCYRYQINFSNTSICEGLSPNIPDIKCTCLFDFTNIQWEVKMLKNYILHKTKLLAPGLMTACYTMNTKAHCQACHYLLQLVPALNPHCLH